MVEYDELTELNKTAEKSCKLRVKTNDTIHFLTYDDGCHTTLFAHKFWNNRTQVLTLLGSGRWRMVKKIFFLFNRIHPVVLYQYNTRGCPTTYQTRHFFNNSKTNEDIATRFEQEYLRCVRNEEECVCSAPSSCDTEQRSASQPVSCLTRLSAYLSVIWLRVPTQYGCCSWV
jgi:hypothetical protein